MHVFMHFKAASKAGPSEPQRLNFATSETGLAQVSTTAATVAVQGRIADTLPWVTLHEFPESGLQLVPACPQMRFEQLDSYAVDYRMQELEAQQQYQQMQMNTIRSCQMTGYPGVSQLEMSAPFIAGPDAVCPFAYWSGDAQTTQRQSLGQTLRRSMPPGSPYQTLMCFLEQQPCLLANVRISRAAFLNAAMSRQGS